MTEQSPADFSTNFPKLFKQSAFRLELLARYVAANEHDPFTRFLTGRPQDPAWREPWQQLVRAAIREEKKMVRVHVVDEPLSDYLQFELTCAYPANVDAGEDVRILVRSEVPSMHLPDYDYWLFDDHAAAVMSYDTDGNWLGASLTHDPTAIASYRRTRDLAIEHSAPLTEYLGSIGLKEAV